MPSKMTETMVWYGTRNPIEYCVPYHRCRQVHVQLPVHPALHHDPVRNAYHHIVPYAYQ